MITGGKFRYPRAMHLPVFVSRCRVRKQPTGGKKAELEMRLAGLLGAPAMQ